jgi:hypothetical protein
MRIASELTIRLVREGDNETVPESEILLNGRPSGKLVLGAWLEAAVQWQNYYLLFMTDDVPFEEWLRIILLDNHLDLLDSARIGVPYSSGKFSSLAIKEPNSVSFHFFADTTWNVELLSKPKIRMPFITEPIGVWRSFSFSRHFIVSENPQPQTR